jgi:hypothetical protein
MKNKLKKIMLLAIGSSVLGLVTAYACNYPWEVRECSFVEVGGPIGGFWNCSCEPYYGDN